MRHQLRALMFAAGIAVVGHVAVAFAQPEQVTTTGGSPTVSLDNQWIAYVDGTSLIRARINGTDPAIIFPSATKPDWSRASNIIVFSHSTTGDIMTVDAFTEVVDTLTTAGGLESPAWEPGGNSVVVHTTSPDGLAILSYPSGALTPVPCTINLQPCQGEDPSWSPDGQWIVFEEGARIAKVFHTGGVAQIVVNKVADAGGTSWSPDGTWVAFSVQDDSNWHIWVSNADGDDVGLWQLTTGAIVDLHPTWSADSNTVFFDRSSGGIWKIGFPSVAVEEQSWGQVKTLYR